IVALLLIVVGIEISISSAKFLFGETPVAPTILALIIIIFSIILKEILFQYKILLCKKYNSTALISDSCHHRSYSLPSIAVIIGVRAALLGEKLNLTFLVYGDAVAGIIVSIIVIKVGYNLAKESPIVILEKVLSDKDTK